MNTHLPKLSKWLIIGLLLCLVGCSRGPAQSTLQTDIQQKLDQTFGSQLFKVADIRRYGSQPMGSTGDDRNQVAIYFKAQLELLRDHHFSNWDSHNAGTLHQLLGSASKGIEGVKDGGNASGDTITVYGLGLYAEQGGGWQAINYQNTSQANDAVAQTKVPEIDSVNPNDASQQDSWQQAFTQQLAQLSRDLSGAEQAADNAQLQAELQAVLRRAQLQQLVKSGQPALLSGDPAGNYNAIAKELTASANPDLQVVSSSGAVENIKLLNQQLASLAFSQSDVVAAAHHGRGQFANRPNPKLRAVAALYPEVIQIVVRRDAGINSVNDLQGKRVNIGPDATGTQGNALAILAAAGIESGQFTRMDIATSVVELEAGRLDAIFITSALPSAYLSNWNEQFKLLAIDSEIAETLTKEAGYLRYEISAEAYPGLTENVNTLAVTAMLVADQSAPDDLVANLLQQLFPETKTGEKDRQYAFANAAIPLHSAAQDFFTGN